MWFATDRGIVRFDGNEFKVFTTDNGLTNNVVFEIFEDAKGKIWFFDQYNQLSYYNNNEIKHYAYNHKIKQLNGNHRGYFYSFYVDDLDNVFIGGQRGFIKIDQEGLLDTTKDIQTDYYRFSLKKIKNKYLGYSLPIREKTKEINLIVEERNLLIPYNQAFKKFKIKEDKDHLYIILSTYLIVYNKTKKDFLIQEFAQECISLYVHESNIYVGLLRGGLKRFAMMNGKLILEEESFKGLSVSSILHDSQAGLWVTTTQQGIFYSANSFVTVIKEEQGLLHNYIYELCNNKNKLTIGYGNYYQELSDGKLSDKIEFDSIPAFYNGDIHYKAKTQDIYYLNGKKVYDIKNKELLPVKELSGAKLFYHNNQLFIRDKGAVFKYISGTPEKFVRLTSEGINDVEIIDDDIWLATSHGIGKYISENNLFRPQDLLCNVKSTAVKRTSNFSLIWTTRGKGLVFKKGDSIFNVSKKDGLITNQFNNLVKDNVENLWAGSNVGLYRFNATNPFEFDFFSTRQGLPSNEITDIVYSNNKVYVSTKNGLAIIDVEKYKRNMTPPKLFIQSVVVDKNTNLLTNEGVNDEIMIPKNGSFLEIGFTGINYKSLGDIDYEYKLEGIHNEWIKTKNRKFQLFNLPVRGDFLFKLRAKNENGICTKDPKVLKLVFIPPFYKTFWFNLGLVFFVLFTITLVVRHRLQLRVRREILKRRIAELENKALQSQMNPHFVFNAMSSIQGLISAGDIFNSGKFLSKFSKLLRSSLQDSRKTSITLSRELENINWYLELESLRFSNSIKYEIILDDKLEVDFIKIPPMLVQPFIENAVIHGVADIDRVGEIKIEFSEKNNHEIICVIEDNGQGRKIDQIGTQDSLGIKIVLERLRVLGVENIKNAIEFIDLKSEDNESIGTKVIVVIPIIED